MRWLWVKILFVTNRPENWENTRNLEQFIPFGMHKIHMSYVYICIYIYYYILYIYMYIDTMLLYMDHLDALPIPRTYGNPATPWKVLGPVRHLSTWFPGEKRATWYFSGVYIGLMIGAPHPKGPPAFFLPWSLLWEFFGCHIFPVGGNEICCVALGGRCNAPIWGKCWKTESWRTSL